MTRISRLRKHNQIFDDKLDPVLLHQRGFVNSLRFDENIRELPLDASQDARGVRVVGGQLTSDGKLETHSDLSDLPVLGNYLGIVDHAEFSGATTTHRLYLITKAFGFLYSYYWNGSAWTLDQSVANTATTNVRSSVISMQNKIFVALQPLSAADYRVHYTSVGVAWAELDPTANYRPYTICPFADRLILFQDYGDPQSIAASVDGDPTDMSGTGSYQSSLVDTPDHPIDALQGGRQIASNILAVFRQRSIMRAFETGNIQLPIGVVHWIHGIGTESPFTISGGPGATFFLGHDKMVYMLTEGGVRPVGITIYDDILSKLTNSALDVAQGVYNPLHNEYWLTFGAGEAQGHIYILDVDDLLMKNRETWRYRRFPESLPADDYVLGLITVSI